MTTDFRLDDCGTVWQFTPLTDKAREFAQTELGLESWQWLGETFSVDHRPAHDLIDFLLAQGFVVNEE